MATILKLKSYLDRPLTAPNNNKEEPIMKLRAVISSLALVSAMALSGGAFAQTVNAIGGVTIPADQLPAFQEKCTAVAAAANQTLATPNDESDDAVATGSVVANGTEDPNASSGSDPASVEEMNALLAGLTAEQCKEAGL